MSLLRISNLARAEPPSTTLAGAWLDLPRAGDRCEAAAVRVQGWCAGREAAVSGIEVRANGSLRGRVPVGQSRPDVGARLPANAWAETSGFSALIDLSGPAITDVSVEAVLANGERHGLAKLTVVAEWPTPTHASARDVVSVVIPCRNQAQFLGEAIESVLAQQGVTSEVIVVNDGSSDNSGAVAARYPTVRYVAQPASGLSAARNTGTRLSQGEFLVYLDADDRLCPGALETNLAELRGHADCALVYGEHRRIDIAGAITQEWSRAPVTGDHYAALLRGNHIGMHGTVMYRRSALVQVGVFDETLRACEDYDVLMRVARTCSLRGHDRVVAEYRQHGRAMSADPALMLGEALRVLRRQRPFLGRDGARIEAYRTGQRHWRRLYGRQALAAAIERYALFGEVTVAARLLWAVARHAPSEFATFVIGRHVSPSSRAQSEIESSSANGRSSRISMRKPE